jgi:hypothetical protein
MTRTGRPSRIAQMAEKIAAKIGMAVDNPHVIDIARLEVAMALEERALDEGRNHNTSNLLNLRTALHDAYQKAGALAPRKVQIAVVEAVQGYYECVHCHKANYLAPDRYEPLTGHYDAQETKPTGQSEANNSPSGDGTPSPALPLEATETAQDAPEPEKAAQRPPDEWRGEYLGPSGHVEVKPLKRLQPPPVVAWRNPDPADVQPVEQYAGLVR